MTVRLELSNNWNLCPLQWRNFARSIHSQHPYVPESVFLLIAKVKLNDQFSADIVEDSERHYIEFTSEKAFTWFMLRWS